METYLESEVTEFIKSVTILLKNIDEKYILEQDTRNIHKEFLLSLKNYSISLDNDFHKVNPKNSIRITKVKFKGIKLEMEGYFYDDNYVLKKGDEIFIHSIFKRIYASRTEIDKQIKIWGVTVRDLKIRFHFEFTNLDNIFSVWN